MLDKITNTLDFHSAALQLRSQRQQILSSNIANADTPNYRAKDIDFAAALKSASAGNTAGANRLSTTNGRHMDTGSGGGRTLATSLLYRHAEQASLDGNSVDLDRERANFADNAMRYEAALRFIDGRARRLMTAIRGE